MTTIMQNYAQGMTSRGWRIVSLAEDQLVMQRRAPIGFLRLILIIILFPIGLLLIWVARDDETKIVTGNQAASAAAAEKRQYEEMQQRIDARRAKRAEFKHAHPFLGRFGSSMMASAAMLLFWLAIVLVPLTCLGLTLVGNMAGGG